MALVPAPHQQLLKRLRKEDAHLYGLVRACRVEARGCAVVILTPSLFHARMLRSPGRRLLLEEAAEATFGGGPLIIR